MRGFPSIRWHYFQKLIDSVQVDQQIVLNDLLASCRCKHRDLLCVQNHGLVQFWVHVVSMFGVVMVLTLFFGQQHRRRTPDQYYFLASVPVPDLVNFFVFFLQNEVVLNVLD